MPKIALPYPASGDVNRSDDQIADQTQSLEVALAVVLASHLLAEFRGNLAQGRRRLSEERPLG